MRKVLGAALPALLFFSLAAPAAAGKKIVPARIAQARYVALGYDMGDRFLSETAAISNPDVLPEERRAIQAIADDLRRWGKYVITVRPEDAELLIAVRYGRRASVDGAIGMGPGGAPVGGPYRGAGVVSSSGRAEISSNTDMLTVYESAGGRVGAQLWRVISGGGLSGAPPRLYQEFRADVERTPDPAKQEPEKKKE